jgi:hypothetical protein
MTNECEVERLLFQQINKPKNYLMLKAINVFGEYYRVNVYTQTEEDGLLKKRIGSNSYFCKLEKNSLRIIPNPEKISSLA